MCKILSIFVVNCCLIFLGCRDLGNVYKVSGSNSVNENRTVANFSAASLSIDKTIQGKDTTPEYQTEIDLKSTDKIESSVAAPKSKKTDFIPGNRRSKLPSFIKGTWEIVKYVEIDGHAYEKPDLAQAEIGKKIILDKFKVKYDQNFCFLTTLAKTSITNLRNIRSNSETKALYGFTICRKRKVKERKILSSDVMAATTIILT